MKIKLFGKDLFEMSKNEKGSYPIAGESRYNNAVDRLEKEKHLMDFHQEAGGRQMFESENNPLSDYVLIPTSNGNYVAAPKLKESKEEEAPKEEVKELTPKEVFQLKTLNDGEFTLKTDPEYVDAQLATLKDKLSMIRSADYDMNRGTIEIASMIQRLTNRKKYKEFGEFYEQYPYTTTNKILELVKTHSYLRLGQVEQFMADMPKEAVEAMKAYTKHTKEMCGKEAIYYIIANKKDFQKSEKRRDPILLAQSPFGHNWQILGAWDEEMVLLEEL